MSIKLSNKGLTLKTSAFLIYHGGNSTFISLFDKTKFSCFSQLLYSHEWIDLHVTSWHDALGLHKVHKDNFNTSPIIKQQILIKVLMHKPLLVLVKIFQWQASFQNLRYFNKRCELIELSKQWRDLLTFTKWKRRHLNILQTIKSQQWDHNKRQWASSSILIIISLSVCVDGIYRFLDTFTCFPYVHFFHNYVLVCLSSNCTVRSLPLVIRHHI